ncbi:PREDICTED: protein FAR1-RELATED SEQUENCE 5-like [Ipomoea nil]|uniref:protein FAR1-RELATED SEQUENCE 5-like n=1 Tax=Ipomoea nil TaxID=35883 RepID=UPI000901B057|nr:PREDICTED: protein FAR1-RELATED SEQUENCE 5-like [Ipomoea nil]
MCIQGMHFELSYILQGLKPKTFEELSSRAHDMELSITANGGQNIHIQSFYNGGKSHDEVENDGKAFKKYESMDVMHVNIQPARIFTEATARIVFKRDSVGRYVLKTFEEAHTHCLCEESYKPFLKVNRKLDVGHQQFITNCSKVNIGASKSFDIYAEMVGGVENVGCTQLDFKNYRREVLAYMQGSDAQMIISKYLDIKSDYSDMYFEYEANEKDQLARVFCADGATRQKYCAFGDVVSFDATYKTNRYSLVFVPFTGVDNHKKCVTFAAALIAREDVDSYCWALRNFKSAMGSAPHITVTDQNPAMKVEIAKEFPETRHRYCMWHIMTKVSDKVSTELARNEEFRRELNGVVWNDSATSEYFEVAWRGVIEKYGLQENAWLKHMYDERATWVPACFEDVFMDGLLRTTSRSKAENRIF